MVIHRSEGLPNNKNDKRQQNNSLVKHIMDLFYMKFSGNRLIYRLIFYFFFGFAFHLYVVATTSHIEIPSLYIGVILGLLGGLLYGRRAVRNIEDNITGNIYKEPQSTLTKRIIILCVFFSIILLLDLVKIPQKVFFPYFALPITLLYPIAVFFTIIWLFRYEKKNGPVHIQTK